MVSGEWGVVGVGVRVSDEAEARLLSEGGGVVGADDGDG